MHCPCILCTYSTRALVFGDAACRYVRRSSAQVILLFTSMSIVWAEVTLALKEPDMSIFSLLIHKWVQRGACLPYYHFGGQQYMLGCTVWDAFSANCKTSKSTAARSVDIREHQCSWSKSVGVTWLWQAAR